MEFDKLAFAVSAVDTASLLNVSVTLGDYYLSKRAFINCSLQYPPVEEECLDEWDPIIQHVTLKPHTKEQQPSRNRERFTTSSKMCDYY